MATTNFVRWASGVGAQLMPIETYKQKAVGGLVPGIADLEQANRAWMQSTAIGAAFAHLVITTKGQYSGVNFDDSETDKQLAEKIFAVMAKRIPAEIADGSINGSKLINSTVQASKLAKTQDLNGHELQIRGLPLTQLQKIVLKDRELAVATDTHALYIGDGSTAGGHLVGGDQQKQIDEIKTVLASLTKAVAVLGNQPKPFGGE